MAPKKGYLLEAEGDLKIANVWIRHVKVLLPLASPKEAVAIMENGSWWDMKTGYEALSVIDEIIESIKTLRGAKTHGPPHVSWFRVTEIED
jgi:hypothetical protein